MSVIIESAWESREWSQSLDSTTQTFIYFICDADFEEADEDYGEFFAPNDDVALAKFIYANFPEYRVFPSPLGGDLTLFLNNISAKEENSGNWKITLVYTLPDSQQIQDNYVQFGFSTNGETIHIERSIGVVSGASRIDIGGPVPETYGLIGAHKQGIDGIDITDRGLTFTVTAYFTPGIWVTGVIPILAALSKCYNNALFYGFPAGEVLFDYAEGQGSAYKYVPVTFYFVHKPNVNGAIDFPFPPLAMLGHDVVDYRYTDDISAGNLVIWPSYRYVHRVRYPGNFNLLGI